MRLKLLTVLCAIAIGLNAQPDTDLDKMIGQMVMVGLSDFDKPDRRETTLNLIKEGKVGGIVLFEKDLEAENTKAELARLMVLLQKDAEIPLFMAIDEEGGRVNRLKAKYGFPKSVSAQYIGEVDDPDSTLYYARLTAQNLYTFGFNVNFAPTVDVAVDPNNPVIVKAGRSYSDSPAEVAFHAGKFIDAHDAYNVATVLKHFPGHGSSTADSHYGVADVSNTWVMEELFPYMELMKDGRVKAIMTAHIVNRSLDSRMLPSTLSDKVITGILREMMDFDGVVFSDDMHMAAISKHYGFEEAVVLSANAGVDVLIFSNNVFEDERTDGKSLHDMIKEKVLSGDIPRERVENSYRRIMELKKSIGLLDPEYKQALTNRLNDLY